MDNTLLKKRANTIQHFQQSIKTSSSTPKLVNSPHSPVFQNSKQNRNNFPLSQSTKLDRYVGNFSTRASGKITCLSPHNEHKSTKTQVQTMEMIVKENLKALNYRQKLTNIEGLVKNAREACQKCGYFYITCAMLFYDPFSPIKLSVWVHPDTRVNKCLHPITKKTQYEKQIEFITNLKTIIKQFFPTIFLGETRTFASLLIHINDLKSRLFSKNKASRTDINHEDFVTHPKNHEQTHVFKKYLNMDPQTTLKKKLIKVPRKISEVSQREEQKEQKRPFQKARNPESMKKKNKEYTDFKEEKLIIQKLKKEQENENKQKPSKMNNTTTKLDTFVKHLVRQPSPSKSDDQKYIEDKKEELENELNDLFGSNDFGGFYEGDGSSIANKKSMMQRMNDEFQQLF